MAEVFAHRAQGHFVHGHEGTGNQEVEYPLEGYGNGRGLAADGVGEDFGNVDPADGPPAEHEGGAVDHDADDRHQGREGGHVGQRHGQGAQGHPQRARNEEGLAAQFLHREYGHQREGNVHHTHDHREEHVVANAHRLEDAGGEIQHGIDADNLLEHRQHTADEHYQEPVGEEFFRLLGGRGLDFGENLTSAYGAVHLGEHLEGLVVLPVEGQEARRLGNQQDKEGEEPGRNGLRHEHHAPANAGGPFHHRRVIGMAPDNQEVHEVHHQLAKDDGELVPGNEFTAPRGRRHLGDVHGT